MLIFVDCWYGVIVVFMLNKQQTTSTTFGMVEKLTSKYTLIREEVKDCTISQLL